MRKRVVFLMVFLFIVLLWALHILQIVNVIDTQSFSINKNNGLISIIIGPFLHSSFQHLVSNTSILILTLPLLMLYYKKHYLKVIVLGTLLPSCFCYFTNMRVIGISGLVYAVLWFLIFSGIASKNKERFIIFIILVMFYSSTLIGITPGAGYNIAWEAHLIGFLTALFLTIRKLFKG